MKHILLAVTGGIAAYKAIDLTSKLTQAGYDVRVMLSEHAQEFVTHSLSKLLVEIQYILIRLRKRIHKKFNISH